MEVKIFQQAQTADIYMEVKGRIVLDACDTLKNTVFQHLTPKIDTLHIDLSNVDFIDSAGLGVMVGIKMTANKCKARLMLIAPSKNVYDILYVSKLENIFDIVTGSEAELLRTSMAAPEHLIQHVSSQPEEALYGDRGLEAAPAHMPSVSSAPSVGVEDHTVGQGTDVTAAASGLVTEPHSQTADTRPSSLPIQEPILPAEPLSEQQSEEDTLNAICKQALELMRQGLYEKAARKYEEALAINAQYLPALNNLAIVYEKKPTWYPKAREQWQRVLEVSESQGDQKHAKRAQKHLENLDKLS